MKILVLSDSHGEKFVLERIIKKERDVDMIIHLGDGLDEFEDIMLNSKITNYSVAGNCDFETTAPYTRIINAAGKRIFIAHGHTFDVKENHSEIIQAAKSKNADICLFGHTHMNDATICNGLLMINPGAVSYNYNWAVIEIINDELTVILEDSIYATKKVFKGQKLIKHELLRHYSK